MKDDILQRIDLVREDEELLLPRKRFGGENAKYIKLGVFKKSPEILDSVPCPNGCGEMVKVIAKTQRGYLVVCDHGDKPSEDIYLPPDEVELYKLDWVTLKRLIGEGAIDYVRPSTPEERKRNPKAAKGKPRGKRGGTRKYSDKDEQMILDFVEKSEYELDRTREGTPCYNITGASLDWSHEKHKKNLPKTQEEFKKAYENIKRRRRNSGK